jgi:NAD(P)H-nitrite reductase large subunit
VEIREDRKNYRRIITRDGLVKGVLLQGDISYGGFWQHVIKNGVDISRLGKPALDVTYADFYGLDGKGRYEWRASA